MSKLSRSLIALTVISLSINALRLDVTTVELSLSSTLRRALDGCDGATQLGRGDTHELIAHADCRLCFCTSSALLIEQSLLGFPHLLFGTLFFLAQCALLQCTGDSSPEAAQTVCEELVVGPS
jgi:hypothetical protein